MTKFPDYAVVGFPKCGTVSLQSRLPPDTPRYEWAYLTFGKDAFLHRFPNTRPIFITRDPVERTWSAYCYFDVFTKMGLEEWLQNGVGKCDQRLGIHDPVKCANYGYYINQWRDLNPIVIKLEDYKKKLPRKNVGGKYRYMNDKERKILEKYLYNDIKRYDSLTTNDEGILR